VAFTRESIGERLFESVGRSYRDLPATLEALACALVSHGRLHSLTMQIDSIGVLSVGRQANGRESCWEAPSALPHETVIPGMQKGLPAAGLTVEIPYAGRSLGWMQFRTAGPSDSASPLPDLLPRFARQCGRLVMRDRLEQWSLGRLGQPLRLIGLSSAMRDLDRFVEAASASSLPVLLQGEFGTEKLATAAAIHCCGPQTEKPFVAVDCSDPDSAACEWLDRAKDGTLYLSAIDRLSLPMQSALPRHLPSRLALWPHTGMQRAPRIIASTTLELPRLVTEGRFSRELASELSVLEARVPPLRERRGDIDALARDTITRLGYDADRKLSDDLIEACLAYDWPENLAEIERLLGRLVTMTGTAPIGAADLRRHAPAMAPDSQTESAQSIVEWPAPTATALDRWASRALDPRDEFPDLDRALAKAMRHLGVSFAEPIDLAELAAIGGVASSRMTDWLAHAMIDLERVVLHPDVQPNVRFFLKGGRALAYLFGRPQDGANDWDSQVLINPDLPADEWYEVYRKVSNRLLVALMRKKAEFYSLLNANAAPLINLPLPVGVPVDPFDDAAPDPGTMPETPEEDRDEDDEETPFSRSCKAELIDVGMPRRDTIECREQWVQLAQDIIRPTEGMPIPGYAYYIDEYLTMVREYFAGEPRAQAKAHKRIERLAELLARDSAAIAILDAYQRIPNTILQIAAQPVAIFAAGQLPPARQPLHYVLIELLDQFATAYDMDIEPLLAAEFAEYFIEWMPQAEALADQEARARFRLSVDAAPMADAIGFGQWLSARLQAHVAGRAALIAAQRDAIDELIRTLYAASIFDQRNEYELQLAIGGSLAAALHADYQNARGATLEPVGKITIGLYYTDRAIDPAVAIELVKPLLAGFVAPQPGALFEMDDSHPGKLLLFQADPETIEPFGPYQPLVIEIVAKRVRVRPLISFIWGLPVLSLRDLIIEYQTRAAHVVEFAMRGVLRKTARALTDMLMKVRQ